jgi:uncharacterized protein (TIGR03435 family)
VRWWAAHLADSVTRPGESLPGALNASPGEASPPDDPLTAFKRILPKQLGLNLDRRKAPVDVLVIDHADKIPTPN